MIASVICIFVLVSWFVLSVSLFVRKRIVAKKTGKPACCCGCSGCSGKNKCPSKK